ncbi:MAG: hypothetical protein GX947_10090, partial [Tissierellia bacterium]|nr:hypothetical protein [Tissierellia bacterium]
MGFFEGFVIGRATANDNNRSGGGGIIGSIIFMLMLSGIYKWIEKVSIEKFGGHFLELSITYILISILLYRYCYKTGRRLLNIDTIGFYLYCLNIILCTIFGFVFFNKIGNTPFGFLIEFLNVLEWGTHNSFAEISGEIIWFILKILHICCKPLGLL